MSPRTAEQNSEIREQRKASILKAALEVFAQNGYASSSVAQIAKSANVSKGLVYNYFDSKEDLLKEMFEMMQASSNDLWNLENVTSPKDGLKLMLDATFTFMEQQQHLGRLMTQLALQKDVINNLKEYIDQFLLEKINMVKTLLADVGIEDANEEAYYLGALLDGMSLGLMMFEKDYPFNQMKNRIYKRYDLL